MQAFAGRDVTSLVSVSCITLAAVMMSAGARHADAQIVCNSATGPDVVVADLVVIRKWGTVGGITGYSIGSLACNVGDTNLEWFDDTNRHPVIAQNAYRLKNGKFEQIGMSWLKHGFYALANDDCCACNNPNDPNYLGVGCSDAYDATLNGDQGGFGGVAGLGPRSEVNPVTGEYLFPYGSQGQTGNAIYKRLQIRNNDVDPALNDGALYFAELQYVTPDDAAAGNDLNNASYMPIQVGALHNGGYQLSYAGPPRPMLPAIYGWQEFDPDVEITPVDVPDDGRFYVGSKVTDNGDGTWRYEYAIFNFNSHRAARQLRIAVPDGVTVSNLGFSDVDYHSGEPFDGTDWQMGSGGGSGAVTWTTSTFAENENANALRWGTMYNFRFTADAGPGDSTGTLMLFRPGAPNNVTFALAGPTGGGGGGGGPNPPANDPCAEAIEVDLGAISFTTVDATSEGGAMACAAAADADVWFRFRSSFTGACRFSLCGASDFDSVIAVYDGCGCGTPLSGGAALACNNNACGGAGKVNVDVVAGRCYLIRVAGVSGASGVSTLTITPVDAHSAARADHRLTGGVPGERFGQSVSYAGDFKNDGAGDVVIGAFRNNDQGPNAGRTRVAMGANYGSGVTFGGENAGDNFGRVVAGGCDFNDDGFDDILVAAPFNDEAGNDAGKVYCFSGIDDSLLWMRRGQLPGDRLGTSIACVGDQNGDGVADALIGAPRNDLGADNAGRAYVVAGQDGSVIAILEGNRAGELFGAAVASVGDATGDGIEDFAIASPGHSAGGPGAGRVTMYRGGAFNRLQIINGAAGESLGSSLAGATASVNATTRTYVLAGAPTASGGRGRTRLYTRNHDDPKCGTFLCPGPVINGSPGEKLGSAVALLDWQGNSIPEMIIGAPGSNINGGGSGAVEIRSAGGTLLRRLKGEAPGDAFGSAVSVAGDLNGDGKTDFIAGAPLNDVSGNQSGRAYVFRSAGAALLLAPPASSDDEPDADEGIFLPAPLAGDVDRDGDRDADDILALISAWGPCGSPLDCPADLDRDGDVDGDDLALAMQ